MAPKTSLEGERLRPLKQLAMNLRLPKWMVLPREKPPHDRHSPSLATVSTNDGTIRTSKEKARYKSPFLVCQLSLSFASARYSVVRIVCSCLEMVLQTTKYTTIYPGSGPSLEVIALPPVVWYWRWTMVTMGVIPRSEKEGTKPPYVCPGCSNHTHGNNMINRCNVIK
jgi:hypothetical protein